MKREIIRRIHRSGALALTIGLVYFTPTTWAVVVSGGTAVANPFNGASTTTGDANFSHGSVGSEFDGIANSNHRVTNTGGTPANTAFIEATRGSATTIGTVISYSNAANNTNPTQSWTIQLGGNVVQQVNSQIANWDDGSQPFAITTLTAPITTTTMRWEVTGIESGRRFDMSETFFLPERVTLVPVAGVTASSFVPGFPGSDATDRLRSTAWVSNQANVGGGDRWLEVNFGLVVPLHTLVYFMERQNQIAEFQRPDGGGGWITFATVNHQANAGSEGVALQLDGILHTDRVRILYDDSQGFTQDTRIANVFFFMVPEPSTVLLFLLGGGMLWRGGRRIVPT